MCVVNTEVARHRMCSIHSRHNFSVKFHSFLFFPLCLHLVSILPPFSIYTICIIWRFTSLHLLKAKEAREEAKEWSVSSPLHFYDQHCLSGLLPTDLGPRHFWTGAICHCHPPGRVVSWGEGPTLVQKRIWAHVCECIIVSYCAGLYILMSICAYGEHSYWNAFSVFTQHWSVEKQQVKVCVCVRFNICDVFCTVAKIYVALITGRASGLVVRR